MLVPIANRTTFSAAPDAPLLSCAPTSIGIGTRQEYEGVGNSSHLGGKDTRITFDSCTLDLTGASAFNVTGHSVLTAANGDELWGTFAMTQDLNGDFVMTSIVFNGGTGRFANATGTATGSGWIDRITLQGYFSLNGMISQPGR